MRQTNQLTNFLAWLKMHHLNTLVGQIEKSKSRVNWSKRQRELTADMIDCKSAREILGHLLNWHSFAYRKKEILEDFLGTGPINPWDPQDRQKFFDALKARPGKKYPEAAAKLEELFREFETEIQKILPAMRLLPEKITGGFASEQIQPDIVGARIPPHYARELGSKQNFLDDLPTQQAEQMFGVKIFLAKDKILIQGARAKEAMRWLERITEPEPEVGMRVKGSIIHIGEFGCFMEFGPRREGLIHISEIARPQDGLRIKSGELGDLIKVGQKVEATIKSFDDRGKIRLGEATIVIDEIGEGVEVCL